MLLPDMCGVTAFIQDGCDWQEALKRLYLDLSSGLQGFSLILNDGMFVSVNINVNNL